MKQINKIYIRRKTSIFTNLKPYKTKKKLTTIISNKHIAKHTNKTQLASLAVK